MGAIRYEKYAITIVLPLRKIPVGYESLSCGLRFTFTGCYQLFLEWYNFCMKYVALIRGINVGGNSIVKMADLKVAMEKTGFANVSTYINSGNVLFESSEKNTLAIEKTVEDVLAKQFKVPVKVVVRTDTEMSHTLKEVPHAWKSKDFRCYIAFIKNPMTPQEVASGLLPKEGVDFVALGPGAVYMATKMEGITKTGFTKVAGTKIYPYMTMRNLNTLTKLVALLSK